jgi:hypothetical protein
VQYNDSYIPPDITDRDKQFLRSYGLNSKKQVKFFARQPQLVLLFMVLSLGTYGIYWSYCNWDAVRRTGGQKIWPLPRAILAILYAWPLFKIMVLQARQRGFERGYTGGMLALGYLLPSIVLAFTPYGKAYDNKFVAAEIAIALISSAVIWLAQEAARYDMRLSPHEEPRFSPVGRWEVAFVIVFAIMPVSLSALT